MESIIKEFKGLNLDKIIRSELGSASLKKKEPIISDLINRIDVIEKYRNAVSQSINDNVKHQIKVIVDHLKNLSNFDEKEFVNNRDQFFQVIEQSRGKIMEYWPHYYLARIEDSGLLENVDFNQNIDLIKKQLDKYAADVQKSIDAKAKEIIDSANEEASEALNKVRKTAHGVSVNEAQKQFEEAAKSNLSNIFYWGILNIIFIILFIIIIFWLMKQAPQNGEDLVFIYKSIIRFFILVLTGTLIAFSLKIFKSYLHMREHNMHRKRIANSVSAFVESANSEEHKDLILSKLVESMTDFGNSGIIGKDDDSPSKISIENFSRTLSSLGSKT